MSSATSEYYKPRVELSQVRERIEGTVGRGRRTLFGRQTGLTTRTKRVIEQAVEETRRMEHSWIGTEHLLLGLIRESEGVAVEVLRDLGVDLDALGTQIAQMMPEEPRGQPALRCTACGRPLCPLSGAATG